MMTLLLLHLGATPQPLVVARANVHLAEEVLPLLVVGAHVEALPVKPRAGDRYLLLGRGEKTAVATVRAGAFRQRRASPVFEVDFEVTAFELVARSPDETRFVVVGPLTGRASGFEQLMTEGAPLGTPLPDGRVATFAVRLSRDAAPDLALEDQETTVAGAPPGFFRVQHVVAVWQRRGNQWRVTTERRWSEDQGIR